MSERKGSGMLPVFGVVGMAAIAFGVEMAVGRISASLPPQPAAPVPTETITSGDVSDLLARLRPFAKDPGGPWYSNGLTLTFYGSSVSLELKMPNGTVLASHAPTLRAAVSGVGEPPAAVQRALAPWLAQSEKGR